MILDKYKDEKWLETASGPQSPDHWLWKWVNPVLNFDAVPLVHETHASILIILGEKYRVIPAQISGYRFEKELNRRSEKYDIIYYPNASHDMRTTKFDIGSGEPPLVKGYLNAMKNWIINSYSIAKTETPNLSYIDKVGESTYFSFHNNFWLNMHHFLYIKALVFDSTNLEEIIGSKVWTKLVEEERNLFKETLSYYTDCDTWY